ncbi:hypothetical protein ABIE12_001254 [Serratia sp. 509]
MEECHLRLLARSVRGRFYTLSPWFCSGGGQWKLPTCCTITPAVYPISLSIHQFINLLNQWVSIAIGAFLPVAAIIFSPIKRNIGSLQPLLVAGHLGLVIGDPGADRQL